MKKLKIDKRVYGQQKTARYFSDIQMYGIVAKLMTKKALMNSLHEIAKDNKEYADKSFIWAVYDEMKLLDDQSRLSFEKFKESAPFSSDILKAKEDILFNALNVFQKLFIVITKWKYTIKYPKHS